MASARWARIQRGPKMPKMMALAKSTMKSSGPPKMNGGGMADMLAL